MRAFVLRSVGVLLLAAAGLKLHGLGVGPVSAGGWTSAAWLQAVVIAGEIVLGWMLVVGLARAAS